MMHGRAIIGLVCVGLAGCADDDDTTNSGDATATVTVTATESGTDTSDEATETATATQGSAEGTGTAGDTDSDPTATTGDETSTGTATESGTTGDTGGTSATEGTSDTTGTDTGDTGDTGDTDDTDDTDDTTTGVVPNDSDGDGIPDDDDPFPDDDTLPGTVSGGTVYAHTPSRLFTMEVEAPYTITEVGLFSFPNGGSGEVTDLAIDRWGVLYAITFARLHVCNPATAACYMLAELPSSFNGLTFIPPGTLDPNDDSLVGVANSGEWRHLELTGNQVNQVALGSYGASYTSAGDAFSIVGVGTFASVNKAGSPSANVIVEVNPIDGSVLGEIASLTGYTTVYGLAGWNGAIFAFNGGGQVLLVDPDDGSYEELFDTNHSWWGAAVSTIVPQ